MTMNIGGEDCEISPEVWRVFDEWYGDKSYRHADMVAELEEVVRMKVVADLRAKAAKDWPGIGVLLEDIIDIVKDGAE
ncbi:hypothetical protein [Streptomyces sp. R44]|uniref:Nucleotide pyrophosphohydrolase n=1 Tax=Streptomyces sp. R44 TaxID=3238633 RepID=A0AB39T7L6_9ACTN